MVEAKTKRRVRQAPEVRREGILEAAARVLLEKGVADTTMEGVAQAAGVAKGTVYLYFDSKDDLVAALQARYASDLVGDVAALLPVGGRGSRIRRLEAFIRGLADSYQRRHGLYHALFEDPGASEAAIVEQVRLLLLRFVQDGVDAGEFSVPDVGLATEFLLHGFHGTLFRALHKPDWPRHVAGILQLARRTLGA